MARSRPKILFAFSDFVREQYLPPAEIQRLETFADWEWLPCPGSVAFHANDDPALAATLRQRVAPCDGLVICHGAPMITDEILADAPILRFIGDLESDRFARRIDLDAAWARGIRTVDTTNGSSYPVAEWALGLILLCMHNGGAHFRRMIQGQTQVEPALVAASPGMLAHKRVGLIGCGHMGRRLVKLLRPFAVEVWAYDPYLAHDMAETLGILQTSLEHLMAECDVIVCTAPHTPRTQGMIGQRELALLRAGTVFVNVSRGTVVDSAALINRLRQGDILAGLDVFDPEPIPPESEILQLPNVFIAPHVGYFSGRSHPLFFALMVDELDRFFNGHETYYDLTPATRANRTGGKAARG